MGSQVPSSSYSPASDSERSVNASYPSPPTRQVEQERGPPSSSRFGTSHRVAASVVPDLLSEDMQWVRYVTRHCMASYMLMNDVMEHCPVYP
ncbi:hypothetical protein JCGZ_05358 [Jatropha curcas]|uniref:Uncharacterized protein n=1 Tax=Jatropha curcas TaxID=180498 RepID=A0A067L1C9_JATCU|nr:hypothetical protein JCGZ_05358 [Jatropha curcas]